MQKLYCYFDESGQDAGSEFFVVVVVVSDKDQNVLREQLVGVEKEAKTNMLKWHKTRHDRRCYYLNLLMQRKIATGEVYTAHYKKPLPYFFPMIEIIERAIKKAAKTSYSAKIYVDGSDKAKAKALTNALRIRGISLRMVKGRRDESEPLIRLADMWAGCLRSALLNRQDSKEIIEEAKRKNYLFDIS